MSIIAMLALLYGVVVLPALTVALWAALRMVALMALMAEGNP
jgi:uncharacterized membrane protein